MNRAAAALPLIAALALTGCVADPVDNTRSTSTITAAPNASTSPNPTPPVDDATVIPVPEAGDDSQKSALTAAEKVVATFAQPTLDPETWMNNLYPLMSQAGAAAYEGTDPAKVPVHQVTGAGKILDGSTEVALIVEVPTDAGPYNVSLSRTGPDAPWLADRIRPAQA
ncbi:hypothetical protein [Herbiconiux sp. VKM Ac-2851]|uniref:hypothetical protein n=1 Tax=Herbiconiux sp. VKM Ac-2851 TaxID=2739025 RepID=UPI0015678A1E|nr:hypothetical protein [Herbiconiux sp. VKM Ac-2851]NQX37100.1 hypothetical protein [Herbiconiux sp. VKM Ac-2851]